jgi:hypothetical protein
MVSYYVKVERMKSHFLNDIVRMSMFLSDVS